MYGESGIQIQEVLLEFKSDLKFGVAFIWTQCSKYIVSSMR